MLLTCVCVQPNMWSTGQEWIEGKLSCEHVIVTVAAPMSSGCNASLASQMQISVSCTSVCSLVCPCVCHLVCPSGWLLSTHPLSVCMPKCCVAVHVLLYQQALGVFTVCDLPAGKSVSVPQWMYDSGQPDSKVAVLVSRASVAEGLAQYVSRLRGCAVGQQVGLGAAGKADISEASRIVFMTHSFFNTISVADPNLSMWGAVIVDEAHERKAEADAVFLRLVAACKARRDFKLVIMSAFIDPSLFAGKLQKQNVPSAVLEVPGVVFPIKDIWFCEEAWNPTAAGAVQSLALECVRVYLQVIACFNLLLYKMLPCC